VRWRNLRLEHFYGPGEGDDKFISSLVRACLKEAEANLTGGEQRREFIFIDDVVRAFEVAFANPDDQDFYGGTGKPIRIRDLAERIHILCGSQATLRFGARPCRENEPIDIGKPDAIPLVRLGWRPAVELDDGLRQVIEFEKARTCVCS
jgi:nucleoside-diphosphate-sugar epimerase